MSGQDWVVDLSDLDARSVARTGGKGASLAALVGAGVPVPAGFVVTTTAYRRRS